MPKEPGTPNQGPPEQTEIKKSIQLTSGPLEELLRKGESLDFRLDQEAWQDLREGDHIEFWEDSTGWQTEPTDDARKVIVRIKHIYKAPTFKELFEVIENDISRLGDKEELLSGLRKWWSEDKEIHEGVLAFHVAIDR
jgi:ASC-1-like (ASCH) protein